MESLLGIGLYTCLYCGEYSKGNRNAIQEFISEHMCPCRNDNEQIINLKECINVLSENASSVLAGAAKESAPNEEFAPPAREVGNKAIALPKPPPPPALPVAPIVQGIAIPLFSDQGSLVDQLQAKLKERAKQRGNQLASSSVFPGNVPVSSLVAIPANRRPLVERQLKHKYVNNDGTGNMEELLGAHGSLFSQLKKSMNKRNKNLEHGPKDCC